MKSHDPIAVFCFADHVGERKLGAELYTWFLIYKSKNICFIYCDCISRTIPQTWGTHQMCCCAMQWYGQTTFRQASDFLLVFRRFVIAYSVCLWDELQIGKAQMLQIPARLAMQPNRLLALLRPLDRETFSVMRPHQLQDSAGSPEETHKTSGTTGPNWWLWGNLFAINSSNHNTYLAQTHSPHVLSIYIHACSIRTATNSGHPSWTATRRASLVAVKHFRLQGNKKSDPSRPPKKMGSLAAPKEKQHPEW